MPKSMAKSRAGPTKPPVETKKPDPDLNEEIDSDSDLESRYKKRLLSVFLSSNDMISIERLIQM